LGDISAKGRLVIGTKGRIEGQINCNSIEVSGYIKGKITANELLNMKSTAQIIGDIVVGRLSVEPGSFFSGSSVMSGTKPLNEPSK
jgi:cytoskeletal protein CcmA (bactofilin family)